MIIKNILMRNFMSCDAIKLNFNKCSVLSGMNDKKSIVLEAISIGLAAFFIGLDDIRSNLILPKHACMGIYPIKIIMDMYVDNKDITCSRVLYGANKVTSTSSAIKHYARELQKQVRAGDKKCLLPIIGYYKSDWLLNPKLNMPKRITRTYGYANCLASQDYRMMLLWIVRMTYIQLQDDKLVPELEVLYKAIRTCYLMLNTSVKDVKFSFNLITRKLELSNGLHTILFKSLDHSTRSIILLVADIAYRMAVLNPYNILSTNGIILLDNIDVGLDQDCQEKLLEILISIFPNVQFIASSNSALILSKVSKDNINLLVIT